MIGIKGMEMPSRCMNCQCLFLQGVNRRCKLLNDEKVSPAICGKMRVPECPLMEVEEPQNDVAYKRFTELVKQFPCSTYSALATLEYMLKLEVVGRSIEAISDAFLAVAKGGNSGERGAGGMKCSKCGKRVTYTLVGHKNILVNENPIMFNPCESGDMEFVTMNGIRKHGNLEFSANEEIGYLVHECKEEA